MKPYTVMLLRSYRFEHIPQHNCEPESDTYFAHIEADSLTSAIKAGRQDAFDADCREYGKSFMRQMGFGSDSESYDFLGLFAGHIEPVWHAWQGRP